MSGHQYVAFVRTLVTRTLLIAVDGCPEEVGAWVHARGIDVIVLCEVAHDGRRVPCEGQSWRLGVFS